MSATCFSPESVRLAATAAAYVVAHAVTDRFLPAPAGMASEPEIGYQLLRRELLREVPLDATGLVQRFARGVAATWSASGLDTQASAAELAQELNRRVAEWCCLDPQIEVDRRRLLDTWDGMLPRGPSAHHWENIQARVREQINAALPPLRAKVELLAACLEHELKHGLPLAETALFAAGLPERAHDAASVNRLNPALQPRRRRAAP